MRVSVADISDMSLSAVNYRHLLLVRPTSAGSPELEQACTLLDDLVADLLDYGDAARAVKISASRMVK